MSRKTTKRLKIAAAEIDIPQSREEVSSAIRAIGELQRERERIQAEMNDKLAAVRADYEAQAKPHADRISELTRGVGTWCEANRAVLTRDGRTKTARFASGEVSWRTRPPSVVVRGKEAVIDTLKRLGLQRLLRVKEDIDKDAVLRERDAITAIRGLSISQREDFVVKPDATELEEVQT